MTLIPMTPLVINGYDATQTWNPIGSDPTFFNYLQKLFPGSSISGTTLTAPGISVDLGSVRFQGSAGYDSSNAGNETLNVSIAGFDSVSFSPEASLPNGGLFLSSGGNQYQDTNTSSGTSTGREQSGNPDLTTFAVATGQANSTNDASVIQLTFTPTAGDKSVFVDLVFGSEEYPEYINSFVDIGAIWFTKEGVPPANYALFDGDASKPLSMIPTSTTDPRFIDNTQNAYPLEFDGFTKTLRIAVPLDSTYANADGSYTINFGVADSNDSALDTAMWISNITSSNFAANGTLLTQEVAPSQTYEAPQEVSNYIKASTDTTITPGTKPDVIECPKVDDAPVTIVSNIQQIKEDKFLNCTGKTIFKLTNEAANGKLLKKQFKIVKGSAKITIDVNDDNGVDSDGTPTNTSDDVTFTLEGDYFDPDLNNWDITNPDSESSALLKYLGNVPSFSTTASNNNENAPITPIAKDTTYSPKEDDGLDVLIDPVTGKAISITAIGSLKPVKIFNSDKLQVSSGSIGYGSQKGEKFVAIGQANTSDKGVVLAGGLGGDTYKSLKGGLTVIADAGGGKQQDKVTGLAGDSQRWQWQLIDKTNFILQDQKNPDTVILLVDPLGKTSGTNKIELLKFGNDTRRIKAKAFLTDKNNKAGPALTFAGAVASGLLDLNSGVGLSYQDTGILLTSINNNLDKLANF